MIKGTTSSGFEFTIEKERLDDWELLEAIRESENNSLAIIDVSKLLLGDAQYKNLKSYIKEKNGSLKVEVMTKEITEILKSSNQTKN